MPNLPSNLHPMIIRNRVIKAIRHFFDKRGFQEIITPVLNQSLPLEPTLYAFKTEWSTLNGTKDLFLATSPEASLKKMLAAGIGNCYSVGKSFRNLESSGPQHNPEFLMLEWYRENANYLDIITDTKELISFVSNQIKPVANQPVSLPAEWQILSLVDLFKQHTGFDLAKLVDEQVLISAMKQKGYTVAKHTWEQLFNQVFLNEIEPYLPQTPFFLVDFPAKISPLCQPQPDRPWLAERFEVYLGGMEIGNGNTEFLDVNQVTKSFELEKQHRRQHQVLTPPIDQEFLAALKILAGTGKTYAGIGLGLDRFAMWLAGVEDIKRVELFTV